MMMIDLFDYEVLSHIPYYDTLIITPTEQIILVQFQYIYTVTMSFKHFKRKHVLHLILVFQAEFMDIYYSCIPT